MSISIPNKRKLAELCQDQTAGADFSVQPEDSPLVKKLKQQFILSQSSSGQYRSPVEKILDDFFIPDLANTVADYLSLVIYTKDTETGISVPRYIDVFSVTSELDRLLPTYAVHAIISSSPVLSEKSFLQSGLFSVRVEEKGADWNDPFNSWSWENGFCRLPIPGISDKLVFKAADNSFPLSHQIFYVPPTRRGCS
jgi:hypothetical protein